ncbi:uncharacterized protein DUF5047 [Jatrophihabitans sp. GAS493]|uniref:DUF5047 domain-containing protein n=1 Tax=Jatrophihabitans sp. GAS493 TaxID=1907575 RepID=UPI000BB96CDF|nr:DUF5047 domain-containing protein [Jatrophihabitans sp. GAS493]SOD72716.1 uncharacterized protein DUF5047 [Jatrophihabitans sp. GAS493]
MQDVSSNFLASLKGSFVPTVQVDAWYDGDLVAENLQVVSGSVTLDSTRAIMGSATVVTVSTDGSLAPTSWDSPLACYGSELHIRAGIQIPASGPEAVSLGWFRIDDYDAPPYFRRVGSGPSSQWVESGVQVTNTCSDRMAAVDDAQFLAPQQPASLASAQDEITLLCQGIVALEPMTGITDVAIPASLSYQQSRVQAISDLAALMGCTVAMSPNGALQLTPTALGASVWDVTVNDTGASRIAAWARKGARTGLYNAVVSTGTASDGTPVQGVANQTTGPLRYGGPFGHVPFGHSSPLITSEPAADTDALTTLTNLLAAQTVVLPLQVPPNTALRPYDVVTVTLPNGTLSGSVQSMTIPLPLSTMTVNLAVPRSQVWGIT